MIPTKKNFEDMTDAELYESICKMIIDTYGIQGFRRFSRLNRENAIGRDYVKESENLYKDMTVEEIYNQAKGFHDEHTK